MTLYQLRYRRDIPEGTAFSTIRLPAHGLPRERVEQMLADMPNPNRFEIVEEST